MNVQPSIRVPLMPQPQRRALALALLLLLLLLFIGMQYGQTLTVQARSFLAWSGSVMPVDSMAGAPPFATDRLTVALTGVSAPPANRQLNVYLHNSTNATGLRCANLPVAGGAINTDCDFSGRLLIGRYDTLTFVQESTVFNATVPTTALADLRRALYQAEGTPNLTAYGVGLKSEAKLLAEHADFAASAAAAGNLVMAKRHTEHLLNILYGKGDSRYGDQDNDGVTTNPGDGYGLLPYRQQLLATMQAVAAGSDSSANMQTRAAQVAVALANIGDGSNGGSGWTTLLIARAAALLATNNSSAAATAATQMAGLATRIYQGEDLNDNGEIEPITGEGGAQTAWRYTQYAADFLTADGTGYVRYRDSTSATSNDSLQVKLTGLPPLNGGEQYWVYLATAAGDYFMAGAVDGSGGVIDTTLPTAGRNLAGAYSSAFVTVGQKIATDILPPLMLGYLCTVMDSADTTPGKVGYGVGLADQAKILADHAGFARDAANAGNRTEARRHAEHVLNILYGANDPRYGDQDNDGVPTNPGDGFGLLSYRQQMASTLALAAAATDATANVRTRVAQVEVALNNIGDDTMSSSWTAPLIERAEALLAAGNIGDVQTFAGQVAALGDRIYRGEEINDNGTIEPIIGEGGALTAYRYTQHAADFYPQALTLADPTPTPTTGTPTPTSPPTATPAPGTPTATPPAGSDSYENDDQCAAARPITTNGLVQRRTFHQTGDNDWVRFDATAGEQYLIEVNIPDSSPADVAMEMYTVCGGVVAQAQDFSFSPAIRLDYTAPATGPVYLKFSNNDPSTIGSQVAYDLTVRSLATAAAPGLLIIVAGQIKNNDPVQPNIYHVTDAVRQLFIDKGATDEQIYYLSPDLSRPGVDASATAANLEAAITQWADQQAATAQSLTIYLMDHGGQDLFYLDKLRGEWISPTELDSWLDQLEALRPTLTINVIYEACESGSFISGAQSISKPGRVIIASTDDVNLAWASDDGAIFSDHLLDSLRRGESLYISYQNARIAAQIAHPNQQAWIDGDGDGNGTDDASQTVAAQRGFNFAGTFPDEVWPPFIAEVQEITPDEAGRAVLRAQVRDDVDVDRVWAVIYPPTYKAPTESEELVQEVLPTTVLLDQGNDWYGARFDGFREQGTYRVVFFADDNQGSNARPVSVNVRFGANTIYLPLVSK